MEAGGLELELLAEPGVGLVLTTFLMLATFVSGEQRRALIVWIARVMAIIFGAWLVEQWLTTPGLGAAGATAMVTVMAVGAVLLRHVLKTELVRCDGLCQRRDFQSHHEK